MQPAWFRYGLAVFALAQTTAPRTFDVASIHLTASADDRKLLRASPGRLEMGNFSLRSLMVRAYDVQDYQISGEPGWVDAERYDIQATAGGSPSIQEMQGPMLRTMLEDRFHLRFHRETKQLPIFELTSAENRARLERTKPGSCIPYTPDLPPPARIAPPQARPAFCGIPLFKTNGRSGRSLEGIGITMAALAENLNRTAGLDRSVVDRTVLTGEFDLHLQWTVESGVFTALRDQLGLRLEPSTGPAEILMIDHVERLSQN